MMFFTIKIVGRGICRKRVLRTFMKKHVAESQVESTALPELGQLLAALHCSLEKEQAHGLWMRIATNILTTLVHGGL